MDVRMEIVKEWRKRDEKHWWKCIQCEFYHDGMCRRNGLYRSLDYVIAILEGKDCPFAAVDSWVICPFTNEMVPTDRCEECGRFTACHVWL
jgi:hypothetical protein